MAFPADMNMATPSANEQSKSDRKRSELVEVLATHLLERGTAAASLRPLAEAAGTSDRMLLYYFRDKADLLSAVLTCIGLRLMAKLEARRTPHPLPVDQLKRELAAIVLADDLAPYMNLFIEIAGLSARGDPFYRSVAEQMGRGFLAWGAAQLDCADAERNLLAAQLMVMTEGLIFLKAIGMSDVASNAIGAL